jgi:hypothetical protein
MSKRPDLRCGLLALGCEPRHGSYRDGGWYIRLVDGCAARLRKPHSGDGVKLKAGMLAGRGGRR